MKRKQNKNVEEDRCSNRLVRAPPDFDSTERNKITFSSTTGTNKTDTGDQQRTCPLVRLRLHHACSGWIYWQQSAPPHGPSRAIWWHRRHHLAVAITNWWLPYYYFRGKTRTIINSPNAEPLPMRPDCLSLTRNCFRFISDMAPHRIGPPPNGARSLGEGESGTFCCWRRERQGKITRLHYDSKLSQQSQMGGGYAWKSGRRR